MSAENEANKESSGLLSDIREPRDLRPLSYEQLRELAEEIRQFIVTNVSATGGHLGPNLGVVELTLGIHRIFDSPHDSILFVVTPLTPCAKRAGCRGTRIVTSLNTILFSPRTLHHQFPGLMVFHAPTLSTEKMTAIRWF